jgi:hypothetical protein
MVENSNRFAALGNLDAELDINRAWKFRKFGNNINISAKDTHYYTFEKHETWFDE